MSGYQGMRWFKCDLQVQTPEDARNWQDADLALGEPRRPVVAGLPDETSIQEKARRFLARCHELELQAIAVTDHNFSAKSEPRDWFLTHLVEQNRSVARDMERDPLVIFPGFEVDIGYHVLCLFPPAKKVSHIARVNRTLTKLGLDESDRFLNGVAQPLRFNGQTVSLKILLDVVQEKHRGIVLGAHADQNDGMLHDTRNIADYQLEDLLCVELTQYPPAQRIRDIMDGRNRDWGRRERLPAVVQSSDAKSLKTGADGRPLANALGYRHTWIKMSDPSIESLRQAFLDHGSRIRLPEDPTTDVNPADRQYHARILALSVEGAAFVEDQEIHFSPNLNCIIGGRGSGKSTLLEYLRLALRKDGSNYVQDDRTKEKIQRIRKTLAEAGSRVRVLWRSRDGVEDELVLASGQANVAGRAVVDAETFFRGLPVRFFSQQQLTQLTEKDSNNLLPLIDNFARADIDALDARERELRAEIASLLQTRREQAVVKGEHQRLSQEIAELTRQRSARAGLQTAAQAHERLQAEQKLAERVRSQASEPQAWVELAEDFVESHSPLGSIADNWPHGDWFKALDDKVEQAKQTLLASVKTAVESYQHEVADLFDKDPDWTAIAAALATADKAFTDACAAQGLSPEEVARVQEIDRELRAKQAELEGKQRKLDTLATEAAPLKDRYLGLIRVWREQHQLREDAADKANRESAPLQQRFLEVTVRYCGDRKAFDAIWNGLAPKDRRTKLAKQWDLLGEAVFEYARQADADSPWLALLNRFAKPESTPRDLADWIEELKGHLNSAEMLPEWENTLVKRVPDLVDVTLYRSDGTRAGSIQDGGLSDGQRNTAALALLLAQGNDPIVIDQPEDELDSSFIYRDLVPMLRRMKDHRQLIFATHNANLPVNGDAELVYALETRNGRGRLLAEGGLDRPAVCSAVLDVMEGSKEAFQRRREKYHF